MSLIFALAIGCSGRGEDTDTTDTGGAGDTDDTDTDDTDTDGEVTGFSVIGSTVDLGTNTAGAADLTVSIADPTPALSGGELEILGSSTTAADGTFVVTGIETDATLGLFMVVSGGSNMPTATGIAAADYSNLGDGDELSGKVAVIVSAALQGGINDSAAPLGYEGDVAADGVLFIAIRDSAGAPVEGATVTCGGCGAPIYYMDATPDDGLFTTAGAPNGATVAAAGALAVVPAGPIATYEAAAGATAGSQLSGSLPGLASFVGITMQ